MPSGQQYATNVPQTTLTSGISAISTTMPVASGTSWPAAPFTAVLDIGQNNQEPVDVTNVAGLNWTITRAIDGTTAQSHGVNATVTHADIGRDFREARAHIDASTSPDSTGHAVHNLTTGSAVVGTIDSQTLTNKVISSGQYTGAQTMGSGAWSGTGSLNQATLSFTGQTGAAVSTTQLVGTVAGGAPTSGTFATGAVVYDTTFLGQWLCTAGGTPGTWVALGPMRLQNVNLGSPAASVTFSSIPQNFNHLRIEISAKSSGSTTTGYDSAALQVNGNSTSNYLWNSWFTTQGAAAVSVAGNTAQNAAQCAEVWNSHFATAGRGIAIIDYPFYSTAGIGKVFTSTSNATDGGTVSISQTYVGGLAAATSTAAITSLVINMGTGNFLAGSTFTLYGIN